MANYAKHLKAPKVTSVNQPIKGRESEMSLNDAGGYGFTLSDENVLKRFIVLGSAGHYYATEKDNVMQNYKKLLQFIQNDGVSFVKIIESTVDTAPKKAPAIFALALAKLHGNEETRKAVYKSIENRTVIRTVGQLMDFLLEIHALNNGTVPMGAGFRKAIKKGFFMNSKKLVEQFVKYRSRSKAEAKFTTLDIVRLMHIPGTSANGLEPVFRWVTGKGLFPMSIAPVNGPSKYTNDYLAAFEEIQKTDEVVRIVDLIDQFGFTWEAIPNTWFSDEKSHARKLIWSKLLESMPVTATLRNVTRMARYGLFEKEDNIMKLAIALSPENIQKSGVHPMQFYGALRAYAQGVSIREKTQTWSVNPMVKNILTDAFNVSYKNVKPAYKKTRVFVDVSGSMNDVLPDMFEGMKIHEACSVLVSVIAKTEPVCSLRVFDTSVKIPNVSAHESIEKIFNDFSDFFGGGTDIGVTIKSLIKERESFDTIIILTDSEGWAGNHISQLFEEYKRKINKNARLIYIQMVGNSASMNDPEQLGAIEILGFDSNVPQLIRNFSAGEF